MKLILFKNFAYVSYMEKVLKTLTLGFNEVEVNTVQSFFNINQKVEKPSYDVL